MATKPSDSLAAKLCRVMKEAKYLEKKGRNTQQGYNYAQEADFLDLIKPLLAAEGIIVLPCYDIHEIADGETKSGTKTCRMTLNLTLTFVDVDSEKTFTVKTAGQGIDTQDKAPYKAMTGALKYAISKTFLIPTGDDPEQDEHEEQKPATKKAETEKKREPVREQAQEVVAETNRKYLDAVTDEIARIGGGAGPILAKYGIKASSEPEFTVALLKLASEARKDLWTELHAVKVVS